MYQRLTTLLKHRVHPLGLLAGSLTVLLLLTALTGMWHYQYELDHVSKAPAARTISYAQTSSKTGNLPRAGTQDVIAGSGQATTAAAAKPHTTIPGQAASTSAAATANSSSPAGFNSSSSPANVAVSLSLNGSYRGEATLSSSSNQCDVLSAALQAGIISNLDMRYNAQYKTYAVYVINGIGDSNAVWWTYAVNGKSPPLGCSNTAVHSGDSVNWQYVKG